jgi:two-component system NtrC family sensor kinase
LLVTIPGYHIPPGVAMAKPTGKHSTVEFLPYDEKHYKELKRRNLVRLILTYSAPLFILTIYFYFQYNAIVTESNRLHLKSIAENQANTLDLFLNERIVNLSNLIDDPLFTIPPTSRAMQDYLTTLKKSSETFVDIGFFDPTGVQTAYAGPYPSLEKRNYSSETWYLSLKDKTGDYVITDMYLGFRQEPHFTIAVKRIIDNQYVVLRATLSPERMYDYIRTLSGASEVYTSVVNIDGFYQLVTPAMGKLLESSSVTPPHDPQLGAEKAKINNSTVNYAYSWLKTADWALIVQFSAAQTQGAFTGFRSTIVGSSVIIIFVTLFVIFSRANKIVEMQKETDRTRMQLEHAAKLASVGELAAGIAHEINNPLAVINEEAGLIKDLMNPEFGEPLTNDDLITRLTTIQESVFRCRDITRKLLGFVRRTDIDLKNHDVNTLINKVTDDLLGQELAVSNIELIKDYDSNLPEILTDSNQLLQVILNLINNAVDAMKEKPGRITISTFRDRDFVNISISDTGCGIAPANLDKIFMPFFTTKEVGKGTGLGLSVSYGIIKGLGGKIEVKSAVGEGTTFIITLPATKKSD